MLEAKYESEEGKQPKVAIFNDGKVIGYINLENAMKLRDQLTGAIFDHIDEIKSKETEGKEIT